MEHGNGFKLEAAFRRVQFGALFSKQFFMGLRRTHGA
jgi:hypothetical protein